MKNREYNSVIMLIKSLDFLTELELTILLALFF